MDSKLFELLNSMKLFIVNHKVKVALHRKTDF